MKKSMYTLITFILFSISAYAQFDINKFFSIDFNTPSKVIKSNYQNVNWEEKSGERGVSFSYFDWLEPSSLKISFSFNTKDQLTIKTITNGKRDEEEAQKVFTQLKEIAQNKFGTKYEEKSFFGVDVLIWKSSQHNDVLLTIKDDRASLIIAKKGSIPMI